MRYIIRSIGLDRRRKAKIGAGILLEDTSHGVVRIGVKNVADDIVKIGLGVVPEWHQRFIGFANIEALVEGFCG